MIVKRYILTKPSVKKFNYYVFIILLIFIFDSEYGKLRASRGSWALPQVLAGALGRIPTGVDRPFVGCLYTRMSVHYNIYSVLAIIGGQASPAQEEPEVEAEEVAEEFKTRAEMKKAS
jgi:hypothetical protein